MQKELNVLKNKLNCLFVIGLKPETQVFLLCLKKHLDHYDGKKDKTSHSVLDLLKWFLEAIAKEVKKLSSKTKKDVHAVLFDVFLPSLPHDILLQISELMAQNQMTQRRVNTLSESRYKQYFGLGKNASIRCESNLEITINPRKLW